MNERRTIVVTGASRGIGRALSAHFLKQGDRVYGCSRGPTDLEAEGYSHAALDVADEKAVVRWVRAIVREAGRIDALVNNAGIASMNHALLTPVATVDSILRTNFGGTFLFCREVAKAMVKARQGRIVNLSTIATPLRLEGESIYAASKAAVESFTEILARELAPTGVTVNAVGPTPVPTDLIKHVPEAKMQALLERQAFRRFGTSEDVINVVEFFLSPRSGFVTGQILYLGGVNR